MVPQATNERWSDSATGNGPAAPARGGRPLKLRPLVLVPRLPRNRLP